MYVAHACVGHTAQLAAVHQSFYRAQRRERAVRVRDRKYLAGSLHSLGDLLCVLGVDGEHLLGEDVLLRRRHLHHDLRVVAGRSADDHAVNALVAEYSVKVCVERQVHFIGELLAALCVVVPNYSDFRVRVVQYTRGVLFGVDVPGA